MSHISQEIFIFFCVLKWFGYIFLKKRILFWSLVIRQKYALLFNVKRRSKYSCYTRLCVRQWSFLVIPVGDHEARRALCVLELESQPWQAPLHDWQKQNLGPLQSRALSWLSHLSSPGFCLLCEDIKHLTNTENVWDHRVQLLLLCIKFPHSVLITHST